MSKERNDNGGVVAAIGGEGYATEITIGGSVLIGDEPVSAGGTGRGPSPYDLLLAALGECKCITLRMYADRKGWPLDAASVSLQHDRVHAEDCAVCETKDGRIDRISCEITLEGELSGEQRDRLLEIADRCPVHRTLTSETRIESRLAE